jgi:SsrA-binding protein
MAKKKDKGDAEKIIENRKARFEYAVLETLECGIVLRGTEVKSVREGKVSLAEGFVRAHPGQLLLYGVNIGEYGPAGPQGNGKQHAPTRARTLLAHGKEIAKLADQVAIKGMTIVPLKMYFKDGFAKVLIGLAKGKTQHDKRDSITKRDTERDMRRAMSKRL